MSSWVAGRRSSASAVAGNTGARAAKATSQEKKRVALGNLTNVVGGKAGAAKGVADAKLSYSNSVANVKKGSLASLPSVNRERGSVTEPTSNQFDRAIAHHGNALQKEIVCCPSVPHIAPTLVPNRSLPGLSDDSVSMEVENPDLKYLDNPVSSVSGSLHRSADDKLHISDNRDVTVSDRRKHCPTPMENDNAFEIDTDYEDPRLCATLACDIYKHLREAETKKRPSPDFVETTQKDVDTNMRAVLIDWLVQVTEEYRLVPETLYLTVNYIDRYLSCKEISRHKLQLLGVSCLLIAAKYEEICAPQVEELCYITDNTYIKDEVLQMEASILSCLKFEMTAPTAKCFLRRFLLVSQVSHEGPALHLEFLASYIAELSLLEYSLLCYVPSLIAASSIFLANFILKPTKNPWNTTISYLTQYKPSELRDCVKVLHHLFRVGPGSKLPAIREKYSQHKYKFVAKRYCPPSVPVEFFQDGSN